MYRGVVFDFDGVIINSFELQKYALRESYKNVVGKEEPDVDVFFSHSGDSLQNIFGYMGYPKEMVDVYNEISSNHIEQIQIYKGMRILLKNLNKKGILCGICTGKNRKRTMQILDYFNLAQYFSTVICSDDVESPKPASDSLECALNYMKVDNRSAIMVGDAPNDILCAKGIGVTSIGVTWGEVAQEVLLNEEPDYIVDTVKELENAIYLHYSKNINS